MLSCRSGRPGDANHACNTMRLCKRSRRDGFAASQQMLCPNVQQAPQKYTDIDARLQIASAFLSGRIAASHIQTVASHLLQAVSGIVMSCGVVSEPVADLTGHLGEPVRKEILQ